MGFIVRDKNGKEIDFVIEDNCIVVPPDINAADLQIDYDSVPETDFGNTDIFRNNYFKNNVFRCGNNRKKLHKTKKIIKKKIATKSKRRNRK